MKCRAAFHHPARHRLYREEVEPILLARQSSSAGSSPLSPEGSSDQASPGPAPTPGMFSYFSHFQFDGKSSGIPTRISDIELTHHYTAVAHRTLYSPCPHAYTALQQDVPREALTSPLLLHQLLAFSALHLAYLNPEDRHQYLIQASQHQSITITNMTPVLTKPDVSTSCHALYASSIFVIISAFGTFPSCDKYNDRACPLDSLVDIFVLIEGMRIILHSSDEQLRSGPLKALLSRCSCSSPQPRKHLRPIASRLAELGTQIEKGTFDLPEAEQEVLLDALNSFRAAIKKLVDTPRMMATPELRVVFGWPMRLSNAYFALLRRRHPLSLAILSYYCVLLRSREDNYWFLEGWATALIQAMEQSLAGSPWEELIRWPVDTIKEDIVEETRQSPKY
ncbi:hypothetical protein B0T10DRAFT_606840 [Thelonectria olida]|uniref:Uncharacterized protein n=1 Tax=Thelonectria olida TaxID=1576542 RepID=A0A9P9APP0_9HYPO|nr:hypothetical protein B0T10DRAFT_606840 [Thelonectria olida]